MTIGKGSGAVAALALGALWFTGYAVAGAATPLVTSAQAVAPTAEQDGSAQRKAKRTKAPAAPVPGATISSEEGRWVILNSQQLPTPNSTPKTPTALPSVPTALAQGPVTADRGAAVPPEMQYLYGSGESAALSLSTYRALTNYLRADIFHLRDKSTLRSVILSEGSTLAAPKFELCGNRPLAIVLDVDETVLLNQGFEAYTARTGAPYDQVRWTRWEQTGAAQVTALPGVVDALNAARSAGITVIYNTNRSASTAAQTIAAMEGAGVGPAVLGETLFLREDAGPSAKDPRRAKIAEKYCVVAQVGDQLGDFTDLLNSRDLGVSARRDATISSAISSLWGAGWFVLPNPVYGSALKGGMDDVFPKDKQWADPAEGSK